MTNNKIVLASITVIVAAGLMALSPSMLGNAQAQMYDNQYGYDNNYYQDDNRYSYDKKDSKSYGDIQKISCVNSNLNVNGIDITKIPEDTTATTAAANEQAGPDAANAQNGNGLADRINFNKNLVNICVNVNDNEQIRITEPETGSLTVNKEIFGCDSFTETTMRCAELEDGDSGWLPCTTDPAINDTDFCEKLPANLFDIEVLDDQNTRLQEFEGSAQGTTIQNLQPGTYTVNEIKDPDPNFPSNVLSVNAQVEAQCVNSQGFDDGGTLLNTIVSTPIFYEICFEYEDEQGNDCSSLTLAPGENKLCTVKNYIAFADQD